MVEIPIRTADLVELGVRFVEVRALDEVSADVCKENAKLIAGMFNPKPFPTHGPCLICGADTRILRGDGYSKNVFCCHGPNCIPF